MLRDCHAIHNTEGKNVGALTGPRGLKHHQERCADSRFVHRSLRQVRRGETEFWSRKGGGEKSQITLHQLSKNSSKLQIISIAGRKKKGKKKKRSQST